MPTDSEFRALLERVEKLEKSSAIPEDSCRHPKENRSRDDPDFCLVCKSITYCGRCGARVSQDQC